jgi:hypothetical protein
MKVLRCVVCRAEFATDEITEATTGCPKCGTESVPMVISQDLQLRINWHELRILTIWASNWADRYVDAGGKRALNSILRELQDQAPEGGAALTLAGEVREIQKFAPDASLVSSDGTVLVPPKGKPS